jgi:hypothetical protein
VHVETDRQVTDPRLCNEIVGIQCLGLQTSRGGNFGALSRHVISKTLFTSYRRELETISKGLNYTYLPNNAKKKLHTGRI